MQNYSIITVGSPVFFECMQEQKTEYNLQNLKSFKEVKEILKTPLIDVYVFLFFVDDLEKLDLKELKKIKYPKIFFSKKSENFKTIKKDNVLSSFLELPVNYQDLEKIIKLAILKFKFLFQSKVEIGKYNLDKNERTISYGKKSAKLTERELDIILYLSGKKEGATKQEIMKDIWSHGEEIDSHTYETHLYRLRQKLQSKLSDKKFISVEDGKYFISS
ncbi:MAG: winged helix-turn-helix domain-containing protein [Pelagibacteraceae bacterium]|jgi:DNA-binding response OmpR family regulator|uniref:winged helix-turn-helix domain-containing protein n=1 Tax=Candidatus Pelagibacter sp. HIMB1517 TaxID=3413341 RepID=UPI0002BE9D1D|nr:response regulator with CheY-like receiver domain and winged-helix DNA-binding domain protein [alpha proteobacterium HIMB114]MCI5053297.1 winged helix-turn-helix domain-containing protein [Pelagibacteraceae bacterium]MCI5079924.1 winged helix-turn-helix domain-containing protein [Pelagibacteraceae bacterium]